MKQQGIWIISVVALAIVAVAFVLLSNIGGIIKIVVNAYGPDITKTEVHLSDVNVSLFSARVEIKGFSLGNPATFQSPRAIEVASVCLDMDEKSLTHNPIIIERITVVAPHITYERRAGTDNIKAILNNIKERVTPGNAPGGGHGEKRAGKRLVIKDCCIKDGKVTLTLSTLGEHAITTPLPDIRLTNIGRTRGGVPPAEAAQEIVAALYEKITGPVVTDALNDQLTKLGSDAAVASEAVARRAKGLEEKLKYFLGK